MRPVSHGAPPRRLAPAEEWNRKSLRYDLLHDRLLAILQVILSIRPASVLDLGCSTGVLGNELATRLPETAYYGCDCSSEAIRRATLPNVVQWDLAAEGLPFDRQFACVVGSGILEYMSDLPRFLRQIRSRLEPGGHAILSYVNAQYWRRLWKQLRGKDPRENQDWMPLFSPSKFRAALTEAGLVLDRTLATSGRIRTVRQDEHRAVWGPFANSALGLLFPVFVPQHIYVCYAESPR